MLKRFFVILQRNWTYELEYGLEVGRMVFISLVTLGSTAIVYRIPNMPQWVFWIFGFAPMFIFWRFYIRYSISRMLQIKANRKYAMNIKKEHIPLIFEAYPNKTLWCKINGKYKRISSCNDVDENDEIKLICVGKKHVYELRKIKKILKDET